jgi:predicted nuclease of predicted toxin-antitoxin system
MKLKLDENLGVRGQALLSAAGHDAATVAEQGLSAASDEEVARHCAQEGRALVTLDLDFANPLRFPPENTAGIAVLRLPGKPSHALLLEVIRTLAQALRQHHLAGKLWIVEPSRIRVHESS